MIDASSLTLWQTVLIAAVILLACIGLVAITCLFYKFSATYESKFDNLNDFYDGCDMKKVRDQWE